MKSFMKRHWAQIDLDYSKLSLVLRDKDPRGVSLVGTWILKGGVEGRGRSGLYVFIHSLLSNFQKDFLFDNKYNEVKSYRLCFPGLVFHRSHCKAMIHSFLSFLGLKDFPNLFKMSWTILSWASLTTWFGKTKMHLKKQKGQTTALPDFLRYVIQSHDSIQACVIVAMRYSTC